MFRNIKSYTLISIWIAATLVGSPVHAYIGPGLGLGVAGLIVGICIVTLLFIAALIILPLRRFIRAKRSKLK